MFLPLCHPERRAPRGVEGPLFLPRTLCRPWRDSLFFSTLPSAEALG